jgi:hypothetical protein
LNEAVPYKQQDRDQEARDAHHLVAKQEERSKVSKKYLIVALFYLLNLTKCLFSIMKPHGIFLHNHKEI